MLSSNILKESTVNGRKPVEGLTLVIDGMEFSYGAFPILKGVTLDIGKPGLISILGPNGVGKSTLIRCINKILAPTGGAVMIDDIDISEITVKELSKIMGYVPCATGTSFPITVTDAVLMGRFPHQK